ncbi:hypothetical protein LTS16_014497 [Friedmanniomyces endolithicus]|nr:hypothetical protein LTS16_014497 [Friedmanniomyces endolithicus]
MAETKKSWQDISAAMLKHREQTIAAIEPAVPDPPKELPLNVTGIPKQLLPADVISITETPTEKLLQKLASGGISSTDVTKAFLQRAGLASKLTNCVTEMLTDRALTRAKYVDDYLATHGPLHGLPISVKEHVSMKGLDINAGFVSWVGLIAPDDALILKLLRNAGAVFYVRTTEPQALMHLETDNNIYGVTVNPYNTALTSGGSSDRDRYWRLHPEPSCQQWAFRLETDELSVAGWRMVGYDAGERTYRTCHRTVEHEP